MTQHFTPQPYPLYAVPLAKADNPDRFELTIDPVRLVLGWITTDDGDVRPALSGGDPGGTRWDGPVFYEETRDRAKQTAKAVEKGDRAAVRDARILRWLERLDDDRDRTANP